MRAVIAQKTDIGQIVQPFGIIHHDGVSRAVTKCQILFEYPANALFVVFDILIRQQRACGVLA